MTDKQAQIMSKRFDTSTCLCLRQFGVDRCVGEINKRTQLVQGDNFYISYWLLYWTPCYAHDFDSQFMGERENVRDGSVVPLIQEGMSESYLFEGRGLPIEYALLPVDAKSQQTALLKLVPNGVSLWKRLILLLPSLREPP